MLLENILSFVHSLLRRVLKAGGRALGAMAGNGHNTLLLTQLVGETGKVQAFDVQSKALAQTQGRLKGNDVDGRIALIYDGHGNLSSYIDEPLDAVVFNFGWLPGGDKSCTTEAASSIYTLTGILGLLRKSGFTMAVLYPGHEADRIEAEATVQQAETLPQEAFAVLRYDFVSRRNAPPYLLTVGKLHQKQMSAVKQPFQSLLTTRDRYAISVRQIQPPDSCNHYHFAV